MNSYYKYNNAAYIKRTRPSEKINKSQLDITPRMMTFMGVAVLLMLSIIFTVSISSSLFEVPHITSPMGNFFVDSYGILSFVIPAYFIFAAAVLIDKAFRPRLIFILNSVIFPFLTLSMGFSFMRDYNSYAARIQFFSVIGKSGFSFIVVLVTMAECFTIYSLSVLFFPEPVQRRRGSFHAVHPQGMVKNAKEEQKTEITLFNAPCDDTQIKPFIRIASSEPSVAKIQRDYAAEFDNFRQIGQEKSEEPLFWALDANLQTLNARLKNLGSDLECIDAQFTTLDSKIENIKDEFDDMDMNDRLEQYELFSDEPRIPKIKKHEESENDSNECSFAGIELESIIYETEKEALKKTEDVLIEQRDKYKKRVLPEYSEYKIPVDDILDETSTSQYWIIDETTKNAARVLTETLREFNIEAEVTGIRKGPVITSFEILPSPGVKLSKIVNLQDNIALRLAAASVRIVAPIPGKHAVGIEIPNKNRSIVSFREIIESELKNDAKKAEIPVILGKDITGEAVTVDLTTMPHLLIAGSTGSGKSVCVNALILSILYQRAPSQCRLILIDPKIVELKLYNDIPHLLTPVITEPKRAFQALQYCIYEMERRYACLDSLGVRDIKTYNRRIKERRIAAEYMPYIVVVIDEFADLMATTGKELESTVARLAAMSRAVGIHLVLATQRPSIDVITGLIKSNIPSRIAFMVASMMDSRIIIDTTGAEKLLGKGDMLYSGVVDPFPVRMQGAFVSEDEVERVVDYVKNFGEPDYIDEEIFFYDDNAESSPVEYDEGSDPLYEKAMEIVVQQGKASASYIQRRLKIGYNRAARLVEEMEHRGIVGPAQGSRPRELLRAV
ncbi:MAG: DNA translocase FtsK [Spirochaetaceae bacterium]|jgi:S-DNA-T family DNA segregation ATPase FtsK/SpoIIIE|nr:DNA translocase FtsK [Spirochaetaceae bacterium]